MGILDTEYGDIRHRDDGNYLTSWLSYVEN